MEAVVRDFGDRNPREDPVIHFYEHFLAAYDKEQKVSRGVFYTPRQVVSYIVRSVDGLLRTEFGLADGLADTTTWGEMTKRHKDLEIPEGTSPDQAFVQILDPATGTGTFLVEVIDLIHNTMVEKWKAESHGEKKIEALWNDYVPTHLLPRLHGYELLMASYAIAHLKIGLKLYETDYRFDSDERAHVYLTNALEPPDDRQIQLDFLPALAHEAEAVNEIKRNRRFTVVIGNPPYLGEAGRGGDWIAALMRGREMQSGRSTLSYFEVDGKPLNERNPKWLNDLYVRFTRLSHWLLEQAGRGVHGFITNHGYIDNPTFRGMRWALLASFDQLFLLDLHGNLKKKEVTPDGRRDENIFDIEQGVAVGLFTKAGAAKSTRHADLWGEREQKYRWLWKRKHGCTDTEWAQLAPDSTPGYLFRPLDNTGMDTYCDWPAINEVMPVKVTGIVTARDDFVIDFDREALRGRIDDLRSESLSDDEIRKRYFAGKGSRKYPPGDSYGWKLPAARQKVREDNQWDRRYVKVLYRPFDTREMYYVPWMIEGPRAEVMGHMLTGENLSITFHKREELSVGYSHFLCSKTPTEHGLTSSKTTNYQAPLYLYPGVGRADGSLFSHWPKGKNGRTPNLNPGFIERMSAATELRFVSDGRGDLRKTFGPEDVLGWIYAVFHSPAYRSRYKPLLKLDFPRVPIPGSVALFRGLAEKRHGLMALHLLESSKLARPVTTYTGPRNPEVSRVGWSDGTVWLDASKTSAREGHRATQSGTIGFRGVPEQVWDFHIGGYQVCHKWLKDRKGRTLSDEDITHYQKIVVALNETIRIMAEIDEVIEAHGGWPDAFRTASERAAKVVPFRPRTVEPAPEDRYVTCVPLVPLKAAAGAFSDPQYIEGGNFEWVEVETRRRLRKGMFVAQVTGKSMEPDIPDGSWCLFRAPVEGTRQGKTVLVQLRDTTDPETGHRYTVKRYKSKKTVEGDSWHHEKITLAPVNPDFKQIVLTGADENELQVIAELIEVLGD